MVRCEMVEEKGLPGHVADKIGEMVVLRCVIHTITRCEGSV